jgi:hypothetical protein
MMRPYTKEMEQFEREYLRSERPDFFRNLQIFEALWEEGVALGVLPPKDPLEGLETKIFLAKVINVPTTAGNDCEVTG